MSFCINAFSSKFDDGNKNRGTFEVISIWFALTLQKDTILGTDLCVPFLKTACGQKISYRGAKLWNDLSRESKMANTVRPRI